jgi:hypothetical protein
MTQGSSSDSLTPLLLYVPHNKQARHSLVCLRRLVGASPRPLPPDPYLLGLGRRQGSEAPGGSVVAMLGLHPAAFEVESGLDMAGGLVSWCRHGLSGSGGGGEI